MLLHLGLYSLLDLDNYENLMTTSLYITVNVRAEYNDAYLGFGFWVKTLGEQ